MAEDREEARRDNAMALFVDHAICLQSISGSAEANRYLRDNGIQEEVIKRVLYRQIYRKKCSNNKSKKNPVF
jgi:hypothetical protein